MDLPRKYTIRESTHRINDPFTSEKLAILGDAIGLRTAASVLDLACGKGEALAMWSRDHGITGVGVDISTVHVAASRARAAEFGVADRLTFIHGDASTFVAETPVDVAACMGATWIGGGTAGTVDLLARSLKPGGIMLIGECYWRAEPPNQEAIEACSAQARDDFETLPGLVASFGALGYDLVEMVLAGEGSWDRYVAAQWFNIRAFLDAHPDDELAPELRDELTRGPLRYVTYQRPLLGWGVFALMKRA